MEIVRSVRRARKGLIAFPVSQEVLSPKEFLSLSAECRRKLEAVSIQVPSLGTSNFGGLLVRYNKPIYKVK